MTNLIWAGDVGPTQYFCPHCQGLWDEGAEAQYEEHMEAIYGPQSPGDLTVSAIDVERGIVTLS